jgi:hypothetical protein
VAKSVVAGVMFKQARRGQGRPRYEAVPYRDMPGRSWMVYDDRVGRAVAFPLHQHEACTLAHTLNVADLRAPAVDFGDRSRSPDHN